MRSDSFSFGVILAEMTGGRHPFRQPSTMETCSAVLREPPALSGDTPRELMVLLQRLLAKDVESRYASIAEVRADLAGLAASSGGFVGQHAHGASAPWRRPAVGVEIQPCRR